MPDCGYPQAGEGSFTLTLTSVAPDAQYDDSYRRPRFAGRRDGRRQRGAGTSMGSLPFEF